MITDELVEAIERLMVEAIGVTAIALAQAGPDVELSFLQWRAMAVVGASGGGIRVGALAGRIGSTVPTTSRLVRRLELRGLVVAEQDAVDRRATRVRLSERGDSMHRTLIARREARVRDALERCGTESSADLVAGLSRIGEALRAYG